MTDVVAARAARAARLAEALRRTRCDAATAAALDELGWRQADTAGRVLAGLPARGASSPSPATRAAVLALLASTEGAPRV